MVRILTTTLFVLLISLLSSAFLISYQLDYKAPKDAFILVKKGASINAIAEDFYSASLVQDKLIFKLIGRFYHAKGNFIQPGEYEVKAGETFFTVFKKLINGERYLRRVTIQEGFTKFQIFKTVINSIGIVNDIEVDRYEEGMLFPDTYFYYHGDKASQLLEAMSSKMSNTLKSYPLPPNHLFKEYKQILTLASIIEKETSIEEERPLVASVYINRLKRGMPLQADPTIIYGLFAGKTDFDFKLTRKDLKFDSPYNTYLYPGLTPSPIASPGKSAILAALYPANTNYLYFVADGRGGHSFAENLNQHNANVFQLRRFQVLQRSNF